MTLLWSKRRTACKTKQVKKHYTQMTLQDKITCVELLKEATNKPLKSTKHYEEKAVNKLDLSRFCSYLSNKNAVHCIVEYNETKTARGTERRVVFRRQGFVRVDNKKCQQYLVIDVDNRRIITTYYNEHTDKHRTLNLKYYDENLTVKGGRIS